MKPTKNKILLFFVIVFMIIPISFTCIIPVGGVSVETTSLYLHGVWSNNQNNYVHIGDYHVFLTADDLLFYDDDAVLVKTWDIPDASATKTPCVSLKDYNTTHLLVSTFGALGCIMHIVDIETLSYTSTDLNGGSLGSPALYYNDNLVEMSDGDIFQISCLRASSTDYYAICRLSGTPSSLAFGDSTYYWYSPSIIIPSATDSDDCYILYKDVFGLSSNRFSVAKIDTVTLTVTNIGTSGLDNTWGYNHTYFIGYSYDTDGTNSWYNVGVAYPINNTAYNTAIQICRFNDTYVDYERITFAPSSSQSQVQIMSCPYSGIRSDITELIEGSYRCVYIGDSYAMRQSMFGIGNLSDINYYVEWEEYYDVTYQGRTHYYSNDLCGGYQPENSNIAFMFTYGTASWGAGKGVADKWFATNPESAYVYWLSPSPIFQLDYNFEIYKNQMYTYTGENFYNQMVYGSGNFSLYSTGIMSSWEVLDITEPTNLILTGSIYNGLLSFVISSRISSLEPAFEKWLLVYEVDDVQYEIEHKIVFVSIGYESWWTDYLFPSATTPPDYTPPTGKEWVSDFVIMFIFVFVPPLVVAYLAGKSDISPMVGYIAGLAITIMIGYQSGITPVWFVFGIIIVMVVIIIELLHSRGRI